MKTIEICLKYDPYLVNEGFAVKVECSDCGKAIMITKSNLLIHVQEKTHLLCLECSRNYYDKLGILDEPLQDYMLDPTDGQIDDFSSILKLAPEDCSDILKVPHITIREWLADTIAGEETAIDILKKISDKED